MSSRTMVMLIAGVIVLFTVISLRNHFSEKPPEAPAHVETQPRALVAKHDLAAGAFIHVTADLDWQPVADDVSREGLLMEGTVTAEEFSGAVVRRSLHAGEKIPATALMKSGEGGFMSAVLEPGKRAVSISVTVTSGNAGFISPGDRVDLLVTHRLKAAGGKESGGDDLVVTETFARSVRVLAVDQQLDNPDNKAILAKTVTVEVTPRQAEMITVAAEMGKISMSLVSTGNAAADDETLPKVVTVDEASKYTRDGDVSSMLGRKENGLSRVRVIRGDSVETLEFYQDVP